MKVIKRDGRVVDFESDKIISAIQKAFLSVNPKISEEDYDFCVKIAEDIASKDTDMNVEDIQNIIVKKLMGSRHKDVAESYVKYRHLREMARNQYKDLMDSVADKLRATNVKNQNANVDEHSFGGRMGEANSLLMRKYALDYLVSPMAKDNHENNEIYIHDLDHYAAGDHNCLSIPFDDLLRNGFEVRQTDIRPAQSLSTALQLVAVIFQVQSLQQFGGVSATHLDWTLVPYVRKSFYKHFMEGVKWVENYKGSGLQNYTDTLPIDDAVYNHFPRAKEYAMEITKKECYQSVEGMYHNLNSLQSRSGNQLPFTSINYGTCTLPEGRMVIKALLDVSIKGIGKLHRTSIFPCGIFQCMKGVNRKPGDPNYDLFKLALESTSQRLYPNYANVDWSGNAGYDINDPRTYFSTMGALDGNEHLYIKINEGQPQDVSIKQFFELCKAKSEVVGRPCQIFYTRESLSLPGSTKKVQNHDFETCKKAAGVYKITYLPQDVSYIGSSNNMQQRWNEHKVAIRTTGGPDCGIKFKDPQLDNYLFEVIEYTDNYAEAEEKYIQTIPNINIRGTAKRYYKTKHRKYDVIYEKPSFKYDLSVPQQIIDLKDMDIKVLDRDNKWVKVLHVFKNDKLNTPQMMHIRYQQFDKVYELSCTEDHPLWDGEKFTRADQLQVGDCLYRADGLCLPIISISWHWEAVDSYDIGTETGSFIGSDVIMHNCRTANGFDINGFGQLKDGRGNICPVTIIMPTLAMEAQENLCDGEYHSKEEFVNYFMSLLDTKIHEAKDMLIERFNWIASQPPEAARFMYENDVMKGYIPEEGIRSALKHGTLAMGQIGLAETLQILIGCDHTTEKGMKVAKEIEQLFNTRCKEFKEQYKLNFGVYFTPAENLCFTAMKKFQAKYGVIPNVSDKEFFTNSIHVPVWKEMTPFEKIDIESQLTGYSNAGCITYVEADAACKYNIDALETIVNYAMDKDIPYFAVNVPNDQCMNCGYTDLMDDECVECHSHDIMHLRRVTGYITNDYLKAFNPGKIQEVQMRVKHTNFNGTKT